MISTELYTGEIPRVYERFAHVIGDMHWKKRIAQLQSEIKGNRFLDDYLREENSIAYQLENLRNLIEQHGAIPSSELNNRANYPAMGFAAQVLSIMDNSPKLFAEQLRRRIHGALKNPDDMRALRLELAAATHFTRRNLKLIWPEMSGTGTFDLMVAELGSDGLEIECKSISTDKGRKIHRREALDFYKLLLPHLKPTTTSLSNGLSVVLTVPGRLPTDYKNRLELAQRVGKITSFGETTNLPDGSCVHITKFDISKLGNFSASTNKRGFRAVVDNATGTQNREGIVIGSRAGGVLALAVQSADNDTLMDSTFDTLSDSAKRQLSGSRGGMFLVGFNGIDGEQLRSVADHDQDQSQPPTALRIAVSRYLSGANRDHVIGVGFLAESGLSPNSNGHIDSGGTAYYFPKRESRFWHDNFSGLFSWSGN